MKNLLLALVLWFLPAAAPALAAVCAAPAGHGASFVIAQTQPVGGWPEKGDEADKKKSAIQLMMALMVVGLVCFAVIIWAVRRYFRGQ